MSMPLPLNKKMILVLPGRQGLSLNCKNQWLKISENSKEELNLKFIEKEDVNGCLQPLELGTLTLSKYPDVDQVLVVSSDVFVLSALERIFNYNNANYFVAGYDRSTKPIVLINRGGNRKMKNFPINSAFSIGNTLASTSTTVGLIKMISAFFRGATNATLVAVDGTKSDFVDNLFDDDNIYLFFLNSKKLKWSDFFSSNLKTKIQNSFRVNALYKG